MAFLLALEKESRLGRGYTFVTIAALVVYRCFGKKYVFIFESKNLWID
jgi:hypothetical protein